MTPSAPTIVQKPWPESSRNRFAAHLVKRFSPPPIRGNRPAILTEAQSRLERLLATRSCVWGPPGLGEQLALRSLTHHPHFTRGGKQRQVRSQALRTVTEVGKCLLEFMNVRSDHPEFGMLEIAPLTVSRISELTRYSVSTVEAALAKLQQARLLKTTRRRRRTPDGVRDGCARREIPRRLLRLLGLVRALAKQDEYRKRRSPRTSKPSGPVTDNTVRSAADFLSSARSMLDGATGPPGRRKPSS